MSIFRLADQDFESLKKFRKDEDTLKGEFGPRMLIPLVGGEDAKKIKSSMDASLNVFRYIDPNNFENRLDRAERSRQAFEDSIDKPIDFIKKKNEARKDFMKAVRELRSFLYGQFFKFGVSPAIAEHLSANVAKELSDSLIKVLDEEIYPSKIEENIYRSRVEHVEKKYASPLKTAVDKKYAGDDAKLGV